MAKHRKTRREKKVADHRHSLYHLEAESTQENQIIEKNMPVTSDYKLNTAVKRPVTSYAYVISDIRKTLLVSSVIIFTQIVLYIYFIRL